MKVVALKYIENNWLLLDHWAVRWYSLSRSELSLQKCPVSVYTGKKSWRSQHHFQLFPGAFIPKAATGRWAGIRSRQTQNNAQLFLDWHVCLCRHTLFHDYQNSSHTTSLNLRSIRVQRWSKTNSLSTLSCFPVFYVEPLQHLLHIVFLCF
jgi:hypothetical protein